MVPWYSLLWAEVWQSLKSSWQKWQESWTTSPASHTCRPSCAAWGNRSSRTAKNELPELWRTGIKRKNLFSAQRKETISEKYSIFNTVWQLTIPPSDGFLKMLLSDREREIQDSFIHIYFNAHIQATSITPPHRHGVNKKDDALTKVHFSYLAGFSSKVHSSVFRRLSTT